MQLIQFDFYNTIVKLFCLISGGWLLKLFPSFNRNAELTLFIG